MTQPESTMEPHVHSEHCNHDHEHHHHDSAPYVRDGGKIGRNDPCPCNSGKKFKKCCGGVKA